MSSARWAPVFVFALAAHAAGCDDTPRPVTLRFTAEIGGAPLACGRTYAGVGTTAATVEPTDARMYVHAPQLITAAGGLVPLALDDDRSQDAEVGLLDFRADGGRCTTDDVVPHAALTGRAPADDYRGVRFEVGLPRALDDRAVHGGAAPFDRAGLWRGDLPRYYFARFTVATSASASYGLWLGASGCDRAPGGGATCAVDNVTTVVLFGDVDRDAVVLDLARLWADVDLTRDPDPADPSAGCQVAAGDPECPPVLARLGLAPSGRPTGAQDAFTMEPR